MTPRRKEFYLHPAELNIEINSGSIFKGLLLAMLSGAFSSLTAVLVKLMNNIPPGQLSVYRFLAIFALSLPPAVKCGENLLGPKHLRFYLILRGMFGAMNTFLNYLAFRYLPLGEASVIIYSVPVFVTVAARIFLKEPCGVFQCVTVVLTVTGILFTAKIPSRLSGIPVTYTLENIYGLLAAIASLVFNTLRFILLRKVKSVHYAVVMFNSSWVSIIETFLLTLILGGFKWHLCGIQCAYILLLGLFSYAGQMLLTIALQCELASTVSSVRSAADIVLAFIWQTIIFSQTPDICNIAGACLVGASVVFVGLRKWMTLPSSDTPVLKQFKWMKM